MKLKEKFMTSGIAAVYNGVVKFKKGTTTNNIIFSGGVNPAEVAPVALVNVRGQLDFTITSADNSFFSQLSVVGGVGELRDGDDQNFYFSTQTNVNCVVTTPQINQLEITTVAPDNRRYILQFYPYPGVPYTIQKTLGPPLTGNLTVQVVTYRLVQHSG
ncbi:MAG TPA: hypothetical protein VLE02_02005 [Nitrosarchaeum sp.]|nr:hypothetical protein [Nitrosarchaeum sp.]